MTMSPEERKAILNQLADGTISANEAAEMLNGANSKTEGEDDLFPKSGEPRLEVTKEDLNKMEEGSNAGPNWLHVRVSDLESGKNRVTVNVPLRLVGLGLNLGSRFVPEMADLDWHTIRETLAEEKGVLVDVVDEEDGDHVLIYVD